MKLIAAADYFKTFSQQLLAYYQQPEAIAIASQVCFDFLQVQLPLLAVKNTTLNQKQIESFDQILNKLMLGEPLQYVLGYAWFNKQQFFVNNAVLIPRPETEELVNYVFDYCQTHQIQNPVIVDLGTGSGCIAISLKKLLPNACVVGVDIMANALKVAQNNGELLNAEITWLKANMLKPVEILQHLKPLLAKNSHQLIIVSNPPYITKAEQALMHNNVLLHEPYTALFAPENDALKFYKSIADLVVLLDSKIDSVWLEVNALLSKNTADLFNVQNQFNTHILTDLTGKNRFVSITKN